ncbi:MAG: YceD family protein [Candidatus Competibacteraceae bacterium]
MQTLPLPEKLKLWQIAAENGSLNGTLALAALPRLVATLNRSEGQVAMALTTGIDAQGIRFIKGVLHAEVELICQRCLGLLRWPLAVTVSLGLARDEAEIDRLPDEYEPLLLAEGGRIAITDLVEDELLLALPQIPRHDDVRECAAYDEARSGEPAPESRQPFAALASLLQDSQLQDSQRSH